MGTPRHVRPDEVEIVVARELRKAGLELSRLRVLARRSLSPKDQTEFSMELGGATANGANSRDVLVEFLNQDPPVRAEAVRAFAATSASRPLTDAPARLMPAPTPSPEPHPTEAPLRIMFATSTYDIAAVREANSLGIALLTIADGPAAFRRSQWSMGEQTPAWVPEYMAELVDLGPDGSVRHQLLVSGQSKLLFNLSSRRSGSD